MNQERKPNSTDCLRLVAACGIIFFHLDFFQKLAPDSQIFVQHLQQLFVTWCLPFFYFTTARFSLQSFKRHASIPKLVVRVVNSQKIILLFYGLSALVYLSKYILLNDGWPQLQSIFQNSEHTLLTLQSIPHFLLGLNPSPVLFLVHVMCISLFSYFLALSLTQNTAKKMSLLAMIVLLVQTLLIINPSDFSAFYAVGAGHTFFIGILVAYLYEILAKSSSGLSIQLTFFRLIYIILGAVLIFGIPSLFFSSSLLLQNCSLILLGYYFFLVDANMKKTTNHKLLTQLSHAGSGISLGVFVLHPSIMKVVDNTVMQVAIATLPVVHPLLLYFLNYLLVVALSLGITYQVVKRFPWLLSLAPPKS